MDTSLAVKLPWIWDWTANAWAAAASWATFGVALLAAWFARNQVLEARRTREEQAQPFVVVDFEPSVAGDIMMISLFGTLVRLLRRMSKSRSLRACRARWRRRTAHTTSPRLQLFAMGYPLCLQARRTPCFSTRCLSCSAPNLPRVYEATVSFSGPRGQSYDPLTYRLDLDIYFGVMNVTTYGSHHAAKALMSIEKTMKKWTANFKGIRVYTRNEDAILDAQRAELESRRRHTDGPGTSPPVD